MAKSDGSPLPGPLDGSDAVQPRTDHLTTRSRFLHRTDSTGPRTGSTSLLSNHNRRDGSPAATGLSELMAVAVPIDGGTVMRSCGIDSPRENQQAASASCLGRLAASDQLDAPQAKTRWERGENRPSARSCEETLETAPQRRSWQQPPLEGTKTRAARYALTKRALDDRVERRDGRFLPAPRRPAAG
jgi:hypothetical protein